MSARENECQILQNYILHMKFSQFYLCFHNSCEIWHNFLGQLNNLIRERREELRGTHPPDSTGNIKDIWLAITQPSWEQKISEKI